MNLQLIDCTHDAHAEQILFMLNHAIAHTTALYDYHPRPLAAMHAWFEAKASHGHPVIGAASPQGELLGFASWSAFRPFAAFKYSVEHSVYVHPEHPGEGIGSLLLKTLVERARKHDLHALVGAIDADNAASIRMHEKLGFTHAGTIRQAGYKFGRWLDLAWYQRILDTPAHPQDG